MLGIVGYRLAQQRLERAVPGDTLVLAHASLDGYRANLNLIVKVLDFVKSGGPILTVDRTVFEMWLGAL